MIVREYDTAAYWRCPLGVTSILVECWGSGGSGDRGGGGGGAYASSTLTVLPLSRYVCAPGVAGDDTTFRRDGGAQLVVAKGGEDAVGAVGGAGGSASFSIGDAVRSGGAGGAGGGTDEGGGGGGGSATALADGGDGAASSGASGGAGGTGEGAGGAGGSYPLPDPIAGASPGGGGGGAQSGHAGAAGGIGRVKLTYDESSLGPAPGGMPSGAWATPFEGAAWR